MGQQLIEVARADFNGDGIEDILLFEYCYATHGTFGFGGITIIISRRADGLFEPIVPCQPYEVTNCVPDDLSNAEIESCVAIIRNGGAVDPESAEGELPHASALAVARRGAEIVGVGAIKRIRPRYASGVAQKKRVDPHSTQPPRSLVMSPWTTSTGGSGICEKRSGVGRQ